MKRILLSFAILLAPAFAADVAAQATLVGTWKLVSWERVTTTGTTSRPFGEHPVGFLMYGTDGPMCAQLMRPDVAKFASPDPTRATDAEARRAFDGVIAYCGTYQLDPKEKNAVIHHVDSAWFPNWVGGDQLRYFTLAGNRLTIRSAPAVFAGEMGT